MIASHDSSSTGFFNVFHPLEGLGTGTASMFLLVTDARFRPWQPPMCLESLSTNQTFGKEHTYGFAR